MTSLDVSVSESLCSANQHAARTEYQWDGNAWRFYAWGELVVNKAVTLTPADPNL